MSAYKVDHIGIAVRSIEEAVGVYRALGLEVAHREEVVGQGVTTAFLPVGESRLELLEPTSPETPVGRFIAKRGPGIHHVCLAVPDIRKALDDLAAKGFRLIDRAPVPGAEGKRVAFLHPAAGHGVLIELSEAAGEAP
ncbi:MAG TPA: methylmalonyl-CoA epimerase [Thermoanaerobaculia bacterium]|nr:methylmalonyl-CoA epimerase [Thermoanaerobaculia bacterium]